MSKQTTNKPEADTVTAAAPDGDQTAAASPPDAGDVTAAVEPEAPAAAVEDAARTRPRERDSRRVAGAARAAVGVRVVCMVSTADFISDVPFATVGDEHVSAELTEEQRSQFLAIPGAFRAFGGGADECRAVDEAIAAARDARALAAGPSDPTPPNVAAENDELRAANKACARELAEERDRADRLAAENEKLRAELAKFKREGREPERD